MDPDKMAVLERNIGRAYRYIGHHAEAVTHFDKALRYLGLGLSTNKIVILLQILMFGLDLFKFFYSPSKKRKRYPDEREDLIINILIMSVSSSGMVGQKDLIELFVQEAILAGKAVKLDLIKYPVLAENLYNIDGYMALGGFMPFLAKKVAESKKKYLAENDISNPLSYRFYSAIFDFHHGSWQSHFDDDLVELNLSIGKMQDVNCYIFWIGLMIIEQGHRKKTEYLVEKSNKIADEFVNDEALMHGESINARYLLKTRELGDARQSARNAVSICHKIQLVNMQIFNLGLKAQIELLSGHLKSSEETLIQAKECIERAKEIILFGIATYLMAQFHCDLLKLENALDSRKTSGRNECKKRCLKSGKKVIAASKKYTADRTEAFRLMGVYHWLVNGRGKAFRWWSKSIQEGEKLGARIETSRTYFEVGKRFTEPKSKYRELNGISAEEYLDKAGKMFQEMELEWDLHELEKVRGSAALKM